MAIIIPVLRKTDLVFTAVGATVMETTLHKAINALAFTQGLLIARVHIKSASSGSTQTFSILVKNAAPTDEDPTVDYIGSTIATAAFTINGGTTGAQTPQIVALAAPISPWLRITMTATQTTQNTVFTLSASADLVLRTDAG